MHRSADLAIDRALDLLHNTAVVRARDLEARGLPRSILTRLVKRGRVERRGRGLYALKDRELAQHAGLVQVACGAPRAVIGLVSALDFHEIGTQIPSRVWIFIPHKGWRPRMKSPPLEIVHCAARLMLDGVETHVLDGVPVRVTSSARTIVDCFKYARRVGLDVALEALREGWRDRRFTAAELMRQARLCRVARIVGPRFEALGS